MRRRKSTIFFLILGICLIALAVALNVGWILLNLREVALMVFGIVFFALIITGLVLNTTFLLREIRRNEQHDAFLNAVTHELKTPIASIRLYLETLKSRDVDPEKRREFYDVMLADSSRLLNTVEQVLVASRTKEKSRQLDLTEVSLNDLLREAIAITKTRFKLAETSIRLSESSAEISVNADVAELQTAFTNLLDNAVKYSSGEPRVTVKIKRSIDNRAQVFIRDSGIGIPSGDLRNIFKRFYRVNNSGTKEKKGTGLGLFIVKSIIKRHGGKIRAESRGIEGKGTTFVITLPAPKVSSEQ